MSMATRSVKDTTARPTVPVRRFTVAEYHWMIDAGFFDNDERFELLEGWIVPKHSRTPPQAVSLGELGDRLRSLLPPGWRVRIRSAITLTDSEPEPDLAVVRGTPRDYLDHHPGPGDLALVIEVADATLAQDRGLKSRIYARAGIPIYGIINLVDHQIEVFTDPTGPDPSPRYRSSQVVRADGEVMVTIDGQPLPPIAARDILP